MFHLCAKSQLQEGIEPRAASGFLHVWGLACLGLVFRDFWVFEFPGQFGP